MMSQAVTESPSNNLLGRFKQLPSDLNPGWLKHLRPRHAAFEENVFAALNTALFQDGTFISIPARRVLERPIHLLHICTEAREGAVIQPRHLIVAGEGSSAKIIEHYASLQN